MYTRVMCTNILITSLTAVSVWWLPYIFTSPVSPLLLSSYISQHVPGQSSLARAGGRWQVGARDALPYVGMGEAVLPTMSSLGVMLLVDGAGETCPWGVGALGRGCWCCYAHQSLKQTGLLWCHHWGGVKGGWIARHMEALVDYVLKNDYWGARKDWLCYKLQQIWAQLLFSITIHIRTIRLSSLASTELPFSNSYKHKLEYKACDNFSDIYKHQ